MIRWRIIREKALRLGVALLASIVVHVSLPGGTVDLEPVDTMLHSAAFRIESPLLLSESAFLIGWIGFGFVLKTRQRTVARTVGGAALSVVAAWALSRVYGPFPPLALFFCWLACPESLYFPRRYAKRAEGKGDEGAARFHISLEMVVAFCALAGLEISMAIGACQAAVAINRFVLGWISLGAPFSGGILCWLFTKKRHESPPVLLRALSSAYHGMEIGAWTAFGLGALMWFA